mmetsp:Transcript_94074/g.304325  ORF Transcript_94074/g.304325 Transcript_94074/m.304325 type:complete len:465 (+) Transcript_94074:91-1485(+)
MAVLPSLLRAPLALSLLGLSCRWPSAAGEIWRMSTMETPESLSLEVRYLFYVSGIDDQASLVSFDGLRLTPPAGRPSGSYNAMWVGLLPWKNFGDLINADSFCAFDGSLQLEKHESKRLAKVVKLSDSADQAEYTARISAPGVYALFVANCGQVSGFSLSGTFSVKNPGGFLSGTEAYEYPVYLISASCAVMALMAWSWLFFSAAELFKVHYYISGLLLITLAEAAVQTLHYGMLNNNGEESTLEAIVVALTATKVALSLLSLFIVTGTNSDEESSPSCGHSILCAGCSLAMVPRLAASRMRGPHNLSGSVLAGSSALVVVAVLVVLCIICRRLSSCMKICRETEQTDALKRLQQTALNIIVTLLGVAVVLVVDQFVSPAAAVDHWSYHALWVAVPEQLVFGLALTHMMNVWAPGPDGFAITAEAKDKPVDQEEGEGERGTLVEDEDGSVGPAADTIGAPSAAE